jgi:hypothetical protein
MEWLFLGNIESKSLEVIPVFTMPGSMQLPQIFSC